MDEPDLEVDSRSPVGAVSLDSLQFESRFDGEYILCLLM